MVCKSKADYYYSQVMYFRSSTVIDTVERYCQSEEPCVMTYFYFDFNDPQKQQVMSLLRSLLTQLSAKSPRCPDVLVNLRSACQKRGQQPTSADLLNTLKDIVGYFGHVYIILDALDECLQQDELLRLLTELSDWKLANLHIVATSRRERWIEDGLTGLVSSQKGLESDLVDADIRTYLGILLAVDSRFQKWSAEERQEIEDTLIKRAHGM